jgi:hypothetical protein
MIPKKQSGRKVKYNLKSLGIQESIDAGKFSRDLMLKVGSCLYYFNRQLRPKRFVQRKVNEKILIYREQ